MLTRIRLAVGGLVVVALAALAFVLSPATGGPDPIPDQPPGEGPIAFTTFEVPRAGGGTAELRVERILSESLDLSRASVLADGEAGMAVFGPAIARGQVCLVFEEPADSQVLTCASDQDFARSGLYASHTPPGQGIRGAFVVPEGYGAVTVNGAPLGSPHGAVVFQLPASAQKLRIVARNEARVIRLDVPLTPGR
jgi:hypothetical protein